MIETVYFLLPGELSWWDQDPKNPLTYISNEKPHKKEGSYRIQLPDEQFQSFQKNDQMSKWMDFAEKIPLPTRLVFSPFGLGFVGGVEFQDDFFFSRFGLMEEVSEGERLKKFSDFQSQFENWNPASIGGISFF